MLVLFARAPRPDAMPWRGRRGLALIDAVAWPALLIALVAQAPFKTGIFGAVVIAIVGASMASRAHRALWCNERYRFTTWRLGALVVALVLLGAMVKLLG